MENSVYNKEENRMGTMPVPRLVIQTGVPLMLSLLINSLYNFVDSIFVARLSEDALTAVSLSSPVQTMMAALGCGIAVGLNAVMEEPETVLLIDAWKDQAAIDAHHASPMMGKISELREKYDLHMEVERYVSDVDGLPNEDMKFIRN
ncbi:MAG: antibiotic biosynthesis monooxygenase [Lachnospiraceae bacterium]|nr:antibiotic biosynthesis monooxygenase [Lachnospiraceae bacterium]